MQDCSACEGDSFMNSTPGLDDHPDICSRHVEPEPSCSEGCNHTEVSYAGRWDLENGVRIIFRIL